MKTEYSPSRLKQLTDGQNIDIEKLCNEHNERAKNNFEPFATSECPGEDAGEKKPDFLQNYFAYRINSDSGPKANIDGWHIMQQLCNETTPYDIERNFKTANTGTIRDFLSLMIYMTKTLQSISHIVLDSIERKCCVDDTEFPGLLG